jgi:phage gp29-like protein
VNLSDRIRQAAGRAGAALLDFSVRKVPRLPDLGLRPYYSPRLNPRTEKALASWDALGSRVTAGAGPSYDRYSSYPATALDPLTIEGAQKAARNGYPYRWADMWEQVTWRDAHVLGEDRKRRQAVANKPLVISPRSETTVAQGLAYFVRAAFDQVDGLPQRLFEALSANGIGYSAMDLCWKPTRLRWPGMAGAMTFNVPREWYWTHPRHFQFTHDTDEPLLDLAVDGFARLPQHKFLWHVGAGQNLAVDRGWITAVVWLHYLKHACGWRDFATFIHQYGLPQLFAILRRDIWESDDIKARVVEMLQRYGTGESAPVLPDGVTVTANSGPIGNGAAGVFASMIGLCNAEISKAILGVTLTTEAGGPGSYALGEVHERGEYETITGDAMGLGSDVQTCVIRSLIMLNALPLQSLWGVSVDDLLAEAPRWSLNLDRETSPQDWLKGATEAADLGVPLSMRQVREKLGLMTPSGDDDVLRGKAIAVPSGGAVVGAVDAAEGVMVPKDPLGTTPQPAPATEATA